MIFWFVHTRKEVREAYRHWDLRFPKYKDVLTRGDLKKRYRDKDKRLTKIHARTSKHDEETVYRLRYQDCVVSDSWV